MSPTDPDRSMSVQQPPPHLAASENQQTSFPLDEGMAYLTLPKTIGADSFTDLKDWLEVVLRKIARSAGVEYLPRSDR